MIELISELFKNNYSYTEYKGKLKEVLVNCMKLNICDSKQDDLNCEIIDGNDVLISSSYYNTIYLSKDLVKILYNGDRISWIYIFYELELIRQKSYLYKGVPDYDINKILKEMILLNNTNLYNLSIEKIGSFYHSEIQASTNTFLNMLLLFKSIGSPLTVEEINVIKESLIYDDKAKDEELMLNSLDAENVGISMENLFDMNLYFHPEWLEMFPQLKLEYYMSAAGVIKRDSYELLMLKREETNNNRKLYINKLLGNNLEKKKRLLN